MHLDVQCVTSGCRIFQGITELGKLEDSHPCNGFLTERLTILRIKFSLTEEEVTHQGTRTNGRFLPVIIERHGAQAQCVGRRLVVISREIHRCITYIILFGSLGRYSFLRHDLQADISWFLQGVCPESGKFGTEIIISVVAEKATQTLAFLFQLDDTEVLSAFQHALPTGSPNQAIGIMGITQIGYRVEKIRLCHINDVTHLRLLRIFLRHFFVGHRAVEITIVTKQIGSHLGACLSIDGRHQHGLCAQVVEYPSAYAFLVLVFHKTVVHPQPCRQRPTH